MKKILLILFMVIYSFALEQKFVGPDEAFKSSAVKTADSVILKLELYEKMYLYDEKIKVFINKPKRIELSSELAKPTPEDYHGEQVTFENLKIIVPLKLIEEKIGKNDFELAFQYQGCSTGGICYAPITDNFKFTYADVIKKDLEIKEKNSDVVLSKTSENSTAPTIIKKTEEISGASQSEAGLITESLKNGNVLLILITFFGFGLLLSLTPCVFPMIPILSSIIVSEGNKQKMTTARGFFLSLVYVLSMASAYTIAGVFAGVFGANLQVALQNPIVLSVFSAIFVGLAFSMFGYYKLELPKSLQTKLSKTTDGKEKQGVFGIAIMGFLSALIVGPCVAAPLAGALVYIGQTGDAVLGGAALFILSIGMGVPLLLIGLGAGKFMPKPGGWMDNVSKVFGVLMLATALWMLDRVLPATITMYLWAILLIGASVYAGLFSPIKENTRGELKLVKLFSIILLLTGVILFVGAISGATNPLNPLKKFTAVGVASSSSSEVVFARVRSIKELDLAIKNSSKPVMLDFYADWCISCKEMEHITFADEKVKKKLAGFTLVQADVTENNDDDKALLKRFNLFGPPGIIFWTKDGKEVQQAELIGFKDPEDFLNHVNKYF
ncbi:thiol:disulfide interchange protein [Arcobacter sp. 31_11_sub10_T18]|nr:thiol:disulfide interchange protein [Arcobacter sp. 31_11_sub10_T18]